MTSTIPDITWDVGYFFNLQIMFYVRRFAWAWTALRARNASPSHIEPPEHVPRMSARAQNCVWGPGESTRKDPRPEEKKKPKGEKNTFICMCEVQGSPSARVRREIPGGAQVDQKGHEGNTAVGTAYNIYVRGNMVKETARQEFLLTTTRYYSR